MLDLEKKHLKDLEWALGLNRLSLRLMGIWPDDEDTDKVLLKIRIPVMIIAIFFCLFLPQMYALTLVIIELPLVIDNLMTSCAAFTSCVKLFFIWRSKKVLRPVIRSVSKDWLRAKRGWEVRAMKREAARARLFTVSGYVVLAGCYAGFAFAPLFGFNIRMISNITDYGDHYLMVQSYLPYDYSKSPNFELTQASQLIAGFFIGMSVSIPDNYFGVLVFHTSAQFEVLGNNVENLIKEDGESLNESQRWKYFNRKLGVFIDRHVHLMRMVSAIEHSFSFVIFAQILCTSVMVCCLGVQILSMFSNSVDKPSSLQVLTLVGTLFTWMMHTLVDCIATEILVFRSGGIFHNVYKSRWYLAPRYVTRDLIPMMMISRIPQKLTAGKIFSLSLATYCSILKSTLGYISVLIAASNR